MNEFRVLCAHEILEGYLSLHPAGKSILTFKHDLQFNVDRTHSVQHASTLHQTEQSVPHPMDLDEEIHDDYTELINGDKRKAEELRDELIDNQNTNLHVQLDAVCHGKLYEDRDEKTDQEFL